MRLRLVRLSLGRFGRRVVCEHPLVKHQRKRCGRLRAPEWSPGCAAIAGGVLALVAFCTIAFAPWVLLDPSEPLGASGQLVLLAAAAIALEGCTGSTLGSGVLSWPPLCSSILPRMPPFGPAGCALPIALHQCSCERAGFSPGALALKGCSTRSNCLER